MNRIKNDFYPTPIPITQVLMDRIKFEGRIFDPCAGHGNTLLPFRDAGLLVVSNEPYPQPGFIPDHRWSATDDGLYRRVGQYDWAVTNPPYDKALMMKIVSRAYQNAKIGAAFLLRLSFLEGCENRYDDLIEWSDHLVKVISITGPRIRFRADTKGTDSITSAWFVFDKRHSWRSLGVGCPFEFVRDWKKNPSEN